MHSYSKISPIFRRGDVKYYRRLHCKKMQEQGKKPITYARFWDRLERGWQLKIAIETPNTKLCNTESSLETNQRREFVIKTAYKDSIQIQPLDDLLKMNRIKMPKPKPTLWQRIKKLLKID